MSKREVEQKVLNIVRLADEPPTPAEVVQRVTGKTEIVRDAIVSLVDRGKLRVTLDWKLRINEE